MSIQDQGSFRLPDPSRAERDIPMASGGHCTAHTVIGDDHGVRVQAESWLELRVIHILAAKPEVVDLREQVCFRYGWNPKKLREHIFDVLVTTRDGRTIACAIKPAKQARSETFQAIMREVAWWVRETGFADEVRQITDADFSQVEQDNAMAMAAVAGADPESDEVAVRVVSGLSGIRSLRDLTAETGMEARGYRALIRLIRKGLIALVSHEPIGPDAVVRRC